MESRAYKGSSIKRPPVVVIMGHIDHGKTALLDKIRQSNIALHESGGITQHIGAYEIISPKEVRGGGEKITFLDTPGHEAFSQMRIRGARVADIVVLVVAADDGIKAQTKEALGVIQSSALPFILAINKIDKAGADPNRVKAQFAEIGVMVEGWGGTVPVAEVSAKEGKGIEHLLELILLVADLEELIADPTVPASGVIIEAHRDPQRGETGTFLIKNGTLHKGDCMVLGGTFGIIKILENFLGVPIEESTFSSPVLVVGLPQLPQVGEEFTSCLSRQEAETLAEQKKDTLVVEETSSTSEAKLTLQLIVKADVAGSIEALEQSIGALSTEGVALKTLKKDVGSINESDIKLASATPNTLILGFRVKIDFSAAALLLRFPDLSLFTGAVIYEVVEQLQGEINQRLKKIEELAKPLGRFLILHIFRRKETSQVVGVRVTEGKIKKGSKADVIKGGEKKAEVRIEHLKRFKEDVEEAKEGEECGVELAVIGQVMVALEEGDIVEIWKSANGNK